MEIGISNGSAFGMIEGDAAGLTVIVIDAGGVIVVVPVVAFDLGVRPIFAVEFLRNAVLWMLAGVDMTAVCADAIVIIGVAVGAVCYSIALGIVEIGAADLTVIVIDAGIGNGVIIVVSFDLCVSIIGCIKSGIYAVFGMSACFFGKGSTCCKAENCQQKSDE